MDHPMSQQIKRAVKRYRGGYLFDLSVKYARKLDGGDLTEELGEEFRKNKEPLSPGSKVLREERGRRWRIEDGDETYLICREGDKLEVCLIPRAREDTGKKEYFDGLVSHVCRSIGAEDTVELRVLVAMSLLGPQALGLPRRVCDELLDLVRTRVSDSEEQKRRVMEFAIPYGCGEFRSVTKGSGGWDNVWDGAVVALVRALHPFVAQAAGSLKTTCGLRLADDEKHAHILALRLLRPEKERFSLQPAEAIRVTSTAGGATVDAPSKNRCLRHLLPGAKLVLSFEGNGAKLKVGEKQVSLPQHSRIVVAAHDDSTTVEVSESSSPKRRKTYRLKPGQSATLFCRDGAATVSIWSCTCGHVACAMRHRLKNWNPKYSLWAFLAASVKGIAEKKSETEAGPSPPADDSGKKKPIRGGSFVQAMYYSLLTAEFPERIPGGSVVFARLRHVQLLYTCCCEKEFAGHVCPDCGLAVDAHLAAAVSRRFKPALVLTGEYEAYERRRFVECKAKTASEGAGREERCGNVMEITEEDVARETKCLRCGSSLFHSRALGSLLGSTRGWVALRQRLRRMRRKLIETGFRCPECGEEVTEIIWGCPVCHSEEFGQRDVFGWVRREHPRQSRRHWTGALKSVDERVSET